MAKKAKSTPKSTPKIPKNLRQLTRPELEKLGFSPNSRRYIQEGKAVRKTTKTFSRRQAKKVVAPKSHATPAQLAGAASRKMGAALKNKILNDLAREYEIPISRLRKEGDLSEILDELKLLPKELAALKKQKSTAELHAEGKHAEAEERKRKIDTIFDRFPPSAWETIREGLGSPSKGDE